MGSAFAIRQYGQLLALEVLCVYVGQAELPPGWLRVLTDERLRPVRDGDVRIGSPANVLGYAWESAISTAFKREVGESPLRYDPPYSNTNDQVPVRRKFSGC